MRIGTGLVLVCGLLLLSADTSAQPPGGKGKGGRGGDKGGARAISADDFVAQFMVFDANKDGKLTKDELTDTRLHRLFDRADTNKDGVVTKEELLALFAREADVAGQDQGPGGPGGRGPGRGGPDGKGKGGPGGRGGPFGGPPQPGQVLPVFLQEQLNLTDDQKKQLGELQKEVDARLEKILTVEQKTQIKEMRDRGPGGRGGRGGPGGPGGPPD